MSDEVAADRPEGAADEGSVDLGEPVIVARFNDHQQAHLAVASLETIGVVAMVEPSNASLGVEAQLTTRPLGIGVLVPSSQADDAYRHLESAGQFGKPETDPSRLTLQARDAMWLALATIPAFLLSPIAYLWASSTARELNSLSQETAGEEYQLARQRAAKARGFAIIGILIFAIVLACLVARAMTR
jgi:hypothetical protein